MTTLSGVAYCYYTGAWTGTGFGRDCDTCICGSVSQNGPIYFKYRAQCSNFGGWLNMPRTVDFLVSNADASGDPDIAPLGHIPAWTVPLTGQFPLPFTWCRTFPPPPPPPPPPCATLYERFIRQINKKPSWCWDSQPSVGS